MSDDDVIDVEPTSTELVASGAAPATLFRTDDPVVIVTRASEVVAGLSQVLERQGLTSRIKDKDYVKVEGWTLCGTMLGVFPVVEWTRPVEGGWEARVEARTKDGAVVGAAEAECLRSESRWKSADDYSIRSMAQTRAISKALRAPLGFIVALAGYETTPEDEMVREERQEQRPFDPGKDLLPGALSGEDANRRLFEALNGFDPTVDWQVFLAEIVQKKYDKPTARDLSGNDYADFLHRLSNAVQWITDHTPAGDFPPVDGSTVVSGFVFSFTDLGFELKYKPPVDVLEIPEEDAPLTADEARLADEAMALEDIPFGDEKE